MKPVLTILGPTASGKSALALALAGLLDGEIVGCDSMQIYRGMDIGTAKPTVAERQSVAHHMIDVVDPGEDYTVARYAVEALACVRDIQARGRVPIVCGGTGFYWRSLYRGASEAPESVPAVRMRLEGMDGDALYRRLCEVDAITAKRLSPNDKRRVVRALEVFELSGRRLSEFQAHGAPRFAALVLGLDVSREVLYRRIDARVEDMVAQGLLDEVKALLDKGLPNHTTAMQAIGYKEFFGVVNGNDSLDSAVAHCQMNTRRYAKRQLTWLAKEDGLHWVETIDPQAIAAMYNEWRKGVTT